MGPGTQQVHGGGGGRGSSASGQLAGCPLVTSLALVTSPALVTTLALVTPPALVVPPTLVTHPALVTSLALVTSPSLTSPNLTPQALVSTPAPITSLALVTPLALVTSPSLPSPSLSSPSLPSLAKFCTHGPQNPGCSAGAAPSRPWDPPRVPPWHPCAPAVPGREAPLPAPAHGGSGAHPRPCFWETEVALAHGHTRSLSLCVTRRSHYSGSAETL